MESPLPSPRLARKASNLPPVVFKTLGLEEDDPEDVFEIHSKEGAGAFGRVFRASYRSDPNRLAALKVIPVALEAGQRGEDIENVRREIQFLRECDHPNVVAFYGAYYKDQALWVAMEYCGGGSVGDVSRRRRLDESEIAVITRGALRGLAYLHARKKIHRDIKGGNILLTTSGEVKIADFGVSAQLKDTLSRRGTFVGTPYWMSPEMIQDSDYDYKSDIWSLGITIIELADQKPPLFDEHPMRVLIQIPRNPPPTVHSPHAWTPLLSQFLAFCLRKDPTERPSAVECLEHAFIERVRDVPFVFADGGSGDASTETEAEVSPVEPARAEVSPPVGRTLASLTENESDSDAMADDVTLKASAARSPKPAPVILPDVVPPPAVESIEWDLAHSTSSCSSRSDDEDTTEENDAAAGGFAFRRNDEPTKPSEKEMVRGDELLQLSMDDDAFEMPAIALITQLQAAASTLAGQSTRLRPTSTSTLTPVPSVPVPLASAPSPILKPSHRNSLVDDAQRRLSSSPLLSSDPPRPRRDFSSFSRTESTGRGVKREEVREESTSDGGWSHALTDLTMPSHDRVNTLLASLSASTTRLLAASPPSANDSYVDMTPRSSFRLSLRPSLDAPLSSSNHFIGSPFRVSHKLNVQYNTLDAKYEGVPDRTEWAMIHKQFGLALAHMRCRTKATDHVPALVHMLCRELVRRDGLECKYIYRVSPDQSDLQVAKHAINSGTFEPETVTDPHVFASLLKIWLRELPTPLLGAITRTDLAAFVETLVKPDNDAGKNSTTADVAFAIAFPDVHAFITTKFLPKLPAAERGVLLWLVDHMLDVMAKSSRNAMTAQSLAVVFAPNVYRWASTTPANASLLSKQVATLLRALVAWRQRCRGGERGDEGDLSVAMRNLSTRSRPSKTELQQSVRETMTPASSISLRQSLHSLRSSLISSAPQDATVSSILRRSSELPTSQFVSATPYQEKLRPSLGQGRRTPLDALLRDCVDGVWGELPLSISLDDPPPIVHSLHTKFQRKVLSHIHENGRRSDARKWAAGLIARVDDKTKAPHLVNETNLPLSLRPYKRWILAALKFEAFTTLLKHERHARERLEKRWPHVAPTGKSPSAEFSAERAFTMGHVLALASADFEYTHAKDAANAEVGHAMVEGASTLLQLLQKGHTERGSGATTSLPLAEELVAAGKAEPAVGNLLVALSGTHTHRYHLEKQHDEVKEMVERTIETGH